MSDLSDDCVYTIREKGKLWEASRQGAASEPLSENKRWVTGHRLWIQASAADKALPVLFGDAAECSRLIGWAVIDGIEISGSGTTFRFKELRALDGHTPQELLLVASGERIAPGFIRPYAICKTPAFLQDAVAEPHGELLPDELVGCEGEVRDLLIRHRRREQWLRDAKVKQVLHETGRLRCEVPRCGFDFFDVYGDLGREFACVHHRKSLADRGGPSETRLTDLAVVCANCHAMIHRGGQCRPLEDLVRRATT